MNADLIEGLARVADSSENVPQLRRLVVTLAISGKLHTSGDEDSFTLMRERLKEERERLVKNGKLKRQWELPCVSSDELPFEISSPCHFERLGNLAMLAKGLTGIQSAAPGPFPLVVTAEDRSSCDHFDFDGAAAIVPMVSSAGHGKASIKRLHYQEGKFALGNILCAVFPISDDLISARFLYEYLTAFKEDLLVTRMIGTANVSLTIGKIAEVPVPLVSRRIQQRVDELMVLCDRLESAQTERESRRDRLAASSLNRLNNGADPDAFLDHARFYFNHLPRLTTRSEHIQQLRQTILNLAVRGKLVSQSPNDEPASELLKRIEMEKSRLVKEGTLARQKLASSEPKELAFDCPMNWQAVNFNDVCNLVTSGSRGWAEFYSDTGPKFIRAQNIRFGRLRLEDLACVSLPKKAEGTRTQISKGDLLIVITGAGVTNPALLDHELGEAYVSQHVALIKPTATSLSPWLLLCLMAPVGARGELVQRAYGAGKPGLNLDNIRLLRISLPPLAEQHRIVAKVDELMALCDRLEAQLTTIQTENRRLLDAILHLALRQVPSTDVLRTTHSSQEMVGADTSTASLGRPNKHFARALLSAEIVHQLHAEPTFGRTKHQKILHLCEHIARIDEIVGEYHREAAGPLDNRMIYSVAAELKKQRWYEEYRRPQYGYGYRPLEKSGGHLKYLEKYWPDKLPVIRRLVDIMRTWDTDRCEMFATVYAAWNDLLILKREPSDEAILEEVLERWHERKKRFSETQWQAAIAWIRKEGFIPVGFGKPTKQLANF